MIIRVGCDCDEVLNSLVSSTLSYIKEIMQADIPFDSLTQYNIRKCIDEAVADQIEFAWAHSQELWNSLSPPDGAVEAMRGLCEEHEVYVVTATHPNNVPWKVEWLNFYYPFIRQDQIIITSHKELIQLDAMIDDCAEQLVKFPSSVERIVVDKPWNRWANDFGMWRVEDLEGARKHLEVK